MMRLLHNHKSRLVMLAVVALILALALTSAQTTVAQSNTWLAEYFGNMTLSGPVLYTEVVPGPGLDMNWPYGEGPRRGGVPDDEFSARFTTTITFTGGNVKFLLNSDDGSRMFLNGELIIDQWFDRNGQWYASRVLPVPAGTYNITVEYYDRAGANLVSASATPTTDEPAQDDQSWIPTGGQGGGGTGSTPPSGGDGGGSGDGDTGGQGGGGAGSSPPPAGAAWLAEYYGNMDLEGAILYTETIPGYTLDKLWPYGEGPRRGGVPDDEWSARFTASRTFPGGNVKFWLNSDDGSRLYINGYLIIDQWKDRAATWYETRVLPLPAGTYTITVEFYDHFGANSLNAGFESTTDAPAQNDVDFALPDWAQPGQGGGGSGSTPPSGGDGGSGGSDGDTGGQGGGGTPTAPPAGGVVVDDGDKAFSWSGSEDWGFGIGGALNNRYLYTGNSETSLKMWGRWNPYLTITGYWDVYAYIPVHANATGNARYRVSHAGILSPVIAVNQQSVGGQWVWLGSFWFKEGISHYLYLNDLTFEGENDRDVLFDAVKFVYSGNGN